MFSFSIIGLSVLFVEVVIMCFVVGELIKIILCVVLWVIVVLLVVGLRFVKMLIKFFGVFVFWYRMVRMMDVIGVNLLGFRIILLL